MTIEDNRWFAAHSLAANIRELDCFWLNHTIFYNAKFFDWVATFPKLETMKLNISQRSRLLVKGEKLYQKD